MIYVLNMVKILFFCYIICGCYFYYDFMKKLNEVGDIASILRMMDNDGMTHEEAIEFIDYNTVRACPYMGSQAPIILRSIEDYLDYSK